MKNIVPRSCQALDAHVEGENGYAERHKSAADDETERAARRSKATDQSGSRHGDTTRVR